MTRDEAVSLIQHRFDDGLNGEWWHQDNGDIYLMLFLRLEPSIGVDGACNILMSAFYAAADEYGD